MASISILRRDSHKSKTTTILIHAIIWFIVFFVPIFLVDRTDGFSWTRVWRSIPDLLSFVLVFYINFLWLIKRYLFKGKIGEFILINLALIIIVVSILFTTHDLWRNFIEPERMQEFQRRGGRRRGPSPMSIITRDIVSLGLVAGLSVAFKMSTHWFEVEAQRKELEKAKSEAELQNIKNQINPHFLLNTLNNIYALIEFDPPKAQKAVLDLCKLLRHLLYDNNKTFASLRSEVDFIQNYIELMRIRLSPNVKLTTHFNIKENKETQISPLIFISLIENAFKHGISAGKESFINISLTENNDGKVEFISMNSYFPKATSDKSGSGIGLDLVKKQLELLYPEKYTMDININKGIYTVILIVDTKSDNNLEQ